jgi:hypothetical protein
MIGLLFLGYACNTTSIISNAVKKSTEVTIRVENHNDAWTDPTHTYTATVKKNGELYELQVNDQTTYTVYKLPANKLELLCEMENSFKDLRPKTALSYCNITIETGKQKRVYRINTDIVHDFITGLKK